LSLFIFPHNHVGQYKVIQGFGTSKHFQIFAVPFTYMQETWQWFGRSFQMLDDKVDFSEILHQHNLEVLWLLSVEMNNSF